MLIAHRIELDPTVAQMDYFQRACGTARFVWNWALSEWLRQCRLGQSPSSSRLRKQFNAMKYQAFPWLKKIHRDAHSQPFLHLDRAWSRFFAERKAGVAAHPPMFKKRGACRDGFYVANDRLTIKETHIRLPVIGWVKIKEALRFGGRVLGASVQRSADHWFLSIQVDVDVDWLMAEACRQVIGVDLNVNRIVCSDGTTYETPRPFKQAQRRMRLLQRRLARKVETAKKLARLDTATDHTDQPRLPASKNREKAVRKLATCHYRVRCVRHDFLHKITIGLVRKNQAVVIEDLQLRPMTKSAAGTMESPGTRVAQKSRFNRAILDVGFGEFRRQLSYKCARYGSRLVVADRWFASSKLCSRCGVKNEKLTLKDRTWCCSGCGARHDRDLNASINLERFATGNRYSALP